MPTYYTTAYRDQQPGLQNMSRRKPQTVSEFRAMIEFDRNIVCQQENHRKCSTCQWTRVRKTRQIDSYGFVASVRNLTPGAHEALDLSEEEVESLSLSLQRATNAGIYASNQLRQYLTYRSGPASILQRLGLPNPGCIPPCEMEALLRLLYNGFLPSPDSLTFQFQWFEGNDGWYGSCGTSNGITYIRMNSLSCRQPPACGTLNSRAMGRLGTLLHELVHAFIQQYACHDCCSHYGNVDTAAGHGHVWHRIANWVEHAARETLGIPVSLTRFSAIQNNWDNMKAFPDPAEARLWELRDE